MKPVSLYAMLPGLATLLYGIQCHSMSHVSKGYEQLGVAMMALGVVIFVVAVVYIAMSFVSCQRRLSESLKKTSFINKLAIFFWFFNAIKYFAFNGAISSATDSSRVGYSWFLVVWLLVYGQVVLLSWTGTYSIMCIRESIILVALAYSDTTIHLYYAGSGSSRTVTTNTLVFGHVYDMFTLVFNVFLIYSIIRKEAKKGILILSLVVFSWCGSGYTFYGIFVCLPLVVTGFVEMKAHSVKLSHALAATSAIVVGFSRLLTPTSYSLGIITDQPVNLFKTVAIIAQVFIWVAMIASWVLVITAPLSTPLSAFFLGGGSGSSGSKATAKPATDVDVSRREDSTAKPEEASVEVIAPAEVA